MFAGVILDCRMTGSQTMAPSGVEMAYPGNNDDHYLLPRRPKNNRSCRLFSEFRRRNGRGFPRHSGRLQPANQRGTARHFWVFGLNLAHSCPTWHRLCGFGPLRLGSVAEKRWLPAAEFRSLARHRLGCLFPTHSTRWPRSSNTELHDPPVTMPRHSERVRRGPDLRIASSAIRAFH